MEIISQPAGLHQAIQEMKESDAIAVDTEGNSRHRYPEQLCLIQIATRHNTYIIDTINLKDLTPLNEVFADESIKKVFHTADSDIRTLDRHGGFRLRNVYDTKIAARLTGMIQFSLVAIIKEVLGVTIEKSAQLQKADWGLRPLSAAAIEYAATDVRYLLSLREELDQRLEAMGRTTWNNEESSRLEEMRYTAPDLETAYLSIKGANTLDGRGLAILRSLFLFREREARRWRRPPFYLIPDSTLIGLAANPDADISDVPGLGQVWLQRFGVGLKQALIDGRNAPQIQLPVTVRPQSPTNEQTLRFNRLREWRASLGTSLLLEPDLIWPMNSLQRLSKAPDTLDSELVDPVIRRWQRDNFGPSLGEFLNSLNH
jgi:ribonuclease D